MGCKLQVCQDGFRLPRRGSSPKQWILQTLGAEKRDCAAGCTVGESPEGRSQPTLRCQTSWQSDAFRKLAREARWQ